MVCRFLPVPVPDHDGSAKRDLLLNGRNLHNDHRVQYLLKLANADSIFRWSASDPVPAALLMVAIACFFSSRSFRRGFNRSAPSRVM